MTREGLGCRQGRQLVEPSVAGASTHCTTGLSKTNAKTEGASFGEAPPSTSGQSGREGPPSNPEETPWAAWGEGLEGAEAEWVQEEQGLSIVMGEGGPGRWATDDLRPPSCGVALRSDTTLGMKMCPASPTTSVLHHPSKPDLERNRYRKNKGVWFV